MDYIIGLDTGTSNTKAIAFSESGKVLGNASVGYSPLEGVSPGHNEQNPDVLYEAMLASVKQLVTLMEGHTPTGISFSAAMHSLIVMDQHHTAITNVITWADLRSVREAEQLRDTPEGVAIYNRTGTPVHPMSPLCKIIWLRNHQPEVFRSAAKFISIKEYFFFRLFGTYEVDYSIASATGLFNIRTRDWDEEALKIAGIKKEQLSTPVSPYTIYKGSRDSLPNVFSFDYTLLFVIGGSDGCLANLGSSAIHPSDVSLTIGTSGAVRMLTTEPKPDSKRRIFNYLLDDEYYISGGPINNGGILLKWYSANFLHKEFDDASDFEWFVDEAMKVPAGAEGLVFLPYIQGERAPVWDANAKGVIIGLHGGHTQLHIMRAIVEGICFSLYQVSASLEESIGKINNIYASGGFIRSKHWLKILADIFNKPIRLTNAADASAVGAAILGMKALGKIDHLYDADSFFTSGETILPDEEEHRMYMKNYDVFNRLYEQVRSLF